MCRAWWADLVATCWPRSNRRPTAVQVLRTLAARDLSDGNAVGQLRSQESQLTVVEQRVELHRSMEQWDSHQACEAMLQGAAGRRPQMARLKSPPTLAELGSACPAVSRQDFLYAWGKNGCEPAEGTVASDPGWLASTLRTPRFHHICPTPLRGGPGIARFFHALLSKRDRKKPLNSCGPLLSVVVRVQEAVTSLLDRVSIWLAIETGAYLLASAEIRAASAVCLAGLRRSWGAGKSCRFLRDAPPIRRSSAKPKAVSGIGPAGIGKIASAAGIHDLAAARPEPALVLFGAGDSLAAGAPFALLGRAVRSLAGIAETDTADDRRGKLADCVGQTPTRPVERGVTAFIGEVEASVSPS